MSEINHTQIDALIVGGGLCGSILAWQFRRAGWDIRVVNHDTPGVAWKGGPAILAPFSPGTLAFDPNYPGLYAAAKAMYEAMSESFSGMFFWESPIIYAFTDSAQATKAADLEIQPLTSPYIHRIFPPGSEEAGIPLPRGGMLCAGGASLSVNRLVEAAHRWMRAEGILVEELVDHEYIELYEDGVVYDEFLPRTIVFAEGAGVRFNPWFGSEMMDLRRGEIIDVGANREGAEDEAILIGERWLLPIADGRFFCGGIEYPNGLESGPSIEGAADLTSAAQEMLGATCNAFAHDAGIIPWSADDYPIIGPHPEYPYLQVFNGLGCRGALLAPYWSKRLALALSGDKDLPEAVLPGRFELDN